MNSSPSDETYQVHLDALAGGGDAVGRLEDGRVVFAALGAPDEDVTLRLTEANARFTRGEILEITRAASTRIEAPCPYYPRVGDRESGCGGCQIQHLEIGAQREIKRRFVVEALQRIGRFGDEIETKVAPCLASPGEFFYRNKAEFAVASTRSGNAPSIGFRARGSHRVVDVARCLIQDELTNQILTALRQELSENPAPILERVVVRVASGEALLVLETSRAAWPQERDFAARLRRAVPQIVGVLRRVPRRAARLIEDDAAPREWLEEKIGDLKLRVTADGFFQVNAAAAALLVEQVRRLAQVESGTRVLDLYCGAGLFALALARNGAIVTGIESGHQAIRDARRNAKSNGLRATFFTDDAARAAQKLAAQHSVKTADAAPHAASTRDGNGNVSDSATEDVARRADAPVLIAARRAAVSEPQNNVSTRPENCDFEKASPDESRAAPPPERASTRAASDGQSRRKNFPENQNGALAQNFARASTRSSDENVTRDGDARRKNSLENQSCASPRDFECASTRSSDENTPREENQSHAENAAGRDSRNEKPFEVIVLDPPRAGAADCLASILELRPARLVYVSCDAATLARDARVLAAGGYQLSEVVPVDLFPQTAHVECVALFREKIL